MSWNKYESGDFLSSDHFTLKTPDQFLSEYVREGPNSNFHGSIIYNDATSGVIWVENKLSFEDFKTIMGKLNFEDWLWNQASDYIKHFRGDNGIFTEDMFQKNCEDKG